jgi:hypothetical protein
MDSGLHSREEPSLFPLVEEGVEGGKGFFFCCPQCIPTSMFPSSSQSVPQDFSQ